MMIDIAAAYRGACQRIKDLGWTQGQWTGANGEECLVQALGMDAGVTTEGDITIRQLPKAVLMPLVHELGLMPEECTRRNLAAALWTWNDEDGRTANEVTALLQRVASRLEAEADKTTEPTYVPYTWVILSFRPNKKTKKALASVA